MAQKLQSIAFVITSAHHGTTQKRQRENRAAATDSQHKGQVGGGRIVSEALKVLAHRLCFVSSGAGLVSSYTAKALLLNTVCGPPRRSDGACSLEHRFILMSTSICDGVTSALVSITSPRPAVCWVCVGGAVGGGDGHGSQTGATACLVMTHRHLAAPAPIKVCDVLSIIIDRRVVVECVMHGLLRSHQGPEA